MDRQQTDLAIADLERRVHALRASDTRPWLYWQAIEPDANAIVEDADDRGYAIDAINAMLAKEGIAMTLAVNR